MTTRLLCVLLFAALFAASGWVVLEARGLDEEIEEAWGGYA